MIYYIDIDDTICRTAGTDYSSAQPIVERIEKINELYDDGHEIHYWTARGTVTGMNWFALTLKQLQLWGAKFHSLRIGKPAYDLFVCDKAVNSEIFFK